MAADVIVAVPDAGNYNSPGVETSSAETGSKEGIAMDAGSIGLEEELSQSESITLNSSHGADKERRRMTMNMLMRGNSQQQMGFKRQSTTNMLKD